MLSALVSPLSDRICIEMCSLTIDDVDSGRLNDRYRATCGKTMASENNGTASRSVYEALNVIVSNVCPVEKGKREAF